MVIGALIPAFNEAGRIGAVVAGARRHVDKVVVIDDGSSDNTAAEAGTAGAECIRSAVREGKGAALRKGIAAIKPHDFTHVVLMDGDGQHDPADIPQLARVASQTGADLVVGARTFVRDAMPLPRYFSNTIGSRVASNMVGIPLSDSQCGFRLMRADKLQELRLRANKYEIEMEMIIKAVAAGYRVTEAPVRTVYEDGQS